MTDALQLLVVEDDADAADSLRMLLELAGHSVMVASSGPAALAAVAHRTPALALVDISLPGMSGYELAPRLRAQPGCARSVLVALSGYAREEDRQRAFDVGFDHHLKKPADFDHIERLIADVARARR
jgi:CheY-like chemotaxis protein